MGSQAVLIGFVLSVKLILDIMDPAGGMKKPEFEVTEEDVEVRPSAFSGVFFLTLLLGMTGPRVFGNHFVRSSPRS